MAITDKERRDLFTAFKEWMGTDNANTAMELLPTQPADQLVTRSDLHAFSAELRAEMIDRFATAKDHRRHGRQRNRRRHGTRHLRGAPADRSDGTPPGLTCHTACLGSRVPRGTAGGSSLDRSAQN